MYPLVFYVHSFKCKVTYSKVSWNEWVESSYLLENVLICFSMRATLRQLSIHRQGRKINWESKPYNSNQMTPLVWTIQITMTINNVVIFLFFVFLFTSFWTLEDQQKSGCRKNWITQQLSQFSTQEQSLWTLKIDNRTCYESVLP